MGIKIILSITTIFTCVSLVLCVTNPVVKTTHGEVKGKILKTLIKDVEFYGFMGIPYAAPPLGDLRFIPPQPIDPWEGTLSATKEKPACLQFNNNVKKEQQLGQYGVEDCLYLDIFTPAIDDNGRAVIVFLFNDHFINSYNKTKDYAPDFFIEEDVLVVTISHRLAVFGFLSLENELLPGNSGLKDIVQGLAWIRDNIRAFGGDPKRITLMGLQGGAAGVDLLLHTEAKHLFSAAILQSGSSWSTAYLQENVKDRAFRLGELLEIGSKDGLKLLKELQRTSTGDLITKDFHSSHTDHFKMTQKSVITFAPIVEKQDDGLLTEYPEDSTENIDIPIMMGFNSKEGMEATLQYILEPKYMFFLRKDFPLLLPRRLKFAFDPLKAAFNEATEEVKAFYTGGKINMKSVPDMINLMGDSITTYAMNHMAGEYSKRSSKPIYYYFFDYYSNLNENKNNINKISSVDLPMGSATGDEMCYLFKCPDLKNEYLKHAEEMSEERIFQMKMIRMWTNFAKYRNPTPEDDELLQELKWPPYTFENKEYLHIHNKMEIGTNLYKERFDFWDEFILKWEQVAVDGIVTASKSNKDEL